MTTSSEKRRIWVTTTFGKMTSGTSMSNAKKSKLLRKLWKQAKKEIK